MRVGVDGYNMAMPHGTGVASYGVGLVETLRSLGHKVDGVFGVPVPDDQALRETAFFDAVQQLPTKARRRGWHRRMWHRLRPPHLPELRRVPLTGLVEQAAMSSGLPRFDQLFSAAGLFEAGYAAFKRSGRLTAVTMPDPPALMHWTYPVPLIVPGIPNIYTFHDLVPLKLPFATLDNKALYAAVVRACAEAAAQICTVSEASRRDLAGWLSIDPERITNTYQIARSANAIGAATAVEDARTIEGVFGLKHRSYFLYVGAIEPKKNVGRLIEAYLGLQTRTPLVLVGAGGWQSEQELQLMPGEGGTGAAGTFAGPRGQTIMRLDYLPRAMLTRLVRGARALVFPSLYEGFGLPVLEAMQLGTPVITSTTSSLPEIAGDAGLLVDPYDVVALREAMATLDADPALGQVMAERGIVQAARFSPDRYRDRLTALYREAMAPR